MLTWEFPYTCLLILVVYHSWYQIISFGILRSVLTSLATWMVYRWRLRKVASAIRIRSDERLAQRTRIAHELYDTMLQTVQGCKLVTDVALEKSNDTAHTRLALEKLSRWLGQATQEGQQGLKSLSSFAVKKNDD